MLHADELPPTTWAEEAAAPAHLVGTTHRTLPINSSVFVINYELHIWASDQDVCWCQMFVQFGDAERLPADDARCTFWEQGVEAAKAQLLRQVAFDCYGGE